MQGDEYHIYGYFTSVEVLFYCQIVYILSTMTLLWVKNHMYRWISVVRFDRYPRQCSRSLAASDWIYVSTCRRNLPRNQLWWWTWSHKRYKCRGEALYLLIKNRRYKSPFRQQSFRMRWSIKIKNVWRFIFKRSELLKWNPVISGQFNSFYSVLCYCIVRSKTLT